MKTVIKKVDFDREINGQHGLVFRFKVQYNDRTGSFLSKTREQDYFVEGKEAEFNEVTKEVNGNIYYNLRPIKKKGNSNFSRKMKAEQSKYSGFAMSYAKDLRMHGMIQGKEAMFKEAEEMFEWMVKKDKELENGK
jgi:hypothetical protein